MPVGKVNNFPNLDKLIKTFFGNDYFIAICAGCWLAATAFSLTGHLSATDWLAALLFFCSTVIIYNLDRLFGDHWSDVKKFVKSPFRASLPEKARANLMHQSLFSVVILYALWQLPTTFILFLLPPFLVSFFYAVPIFGKEARPRDIPFLKIFLIAFVWAWITTLPVGVPTYTDPTRWAMFISRFCFIYAITIPFDLRDLLHDKAKNTQTIPHKIGQRKSLATAFAALFIGCCVAFIGQTPDMWPHVITSLLAAVIIAQWNPTRAYYYYLFYLDGCILFHALLIVAFKLWKT